MAGVPDSGLPGAGPWPLGINNLAKEGRLPGDENGRLIALREADNIDIDRDGYVSRRPGATRVHAGNLTHSLWSDPGLSFGLFADAGELAIFDSDESVHPLGVMVGNQPISYALIGDKVFWSNRTVCGLVTLDRQALPWAPEFPAGQPALSAAAGFGLRAGQYQVAVTFTDVLGRESGSTLAAVIELAAESGIQLSSIPQPLDPAAAPIINIYVSDPNDQVLRLHISLPVGITTYLVGSSATGRMLTTQFMREMPAGQIVRLYNGRQYVANGRYMRWSPAMRYGLTNRAGAVIGFDATIDLMEPVQGGGMFVAAGARTYFFAGAEPDQFIQRIVQASGAVPGSAARVPGDSLGFDTAEERLVWLSRRGQFCIGGPDGSVVPLKKGEAVVDNADRAATLFRADNGLQQLITSLRAPRGIGSLAIRDRAVAHIVHDERDPP